MNARTTMVIALLAACGGSGGGGPGSIDAAHDGPGGDSSPPRTRR